MGGNNLGSTRDVIRQQLIEKLEEIRQMNIEPYPYKYDVKDYVEDINERFDEIEDIPIEEYNVKLAGRIMTKRHHGKSSFAHVQDSTGQIQIYVRVDVVGEEKYELFKKIDPGDIIGFEGYIFRTHTKELTVFVHELKLLSKAIRPLPEKWHGLQDKETRYRRRYVDLIVNPEVKQVFITRTKIIQAIRDFLNNKGFLEVETPVLQPIYGGANARPFVTHHNVLDMPLYLRISDELYLKRLVVGGFDRVYEFAKDFRNEGMDRDHNPEFTLMEAYQAYADYNDIMCLTEEMVSYTAQEVLGTTKIQYQDMQIDLSPPWKRITMIDSIKEQINIDVSEMELSELQNLVKKNNIEITGTEPKGKLIGMLFDSLVEPNLAQPTFITDYPIDVSPLAKKKPGDNEFVERFEYFIGKLELGNAFSELNDPIDQKKRFEQQAKQREAGDEEAHMVDEDFIRAIEYGMPPTGGLGLGVDRLVMLFTDQSSIRDVIFFPQMRPEA